MRREIRKEISKRVRYAGALIVVIPAVSFLVVGRILISLSHLLCGDAEMARLELESLWR